MSCCDLPPGLEAEILALLKEGRTIAAIQYLRAMTGAPLKDCKDWVDHRLLEVLPFQKRCDGKPCPYCGQPLRTNKAMQCFECGMDWHHPDAIVQHPVVPREKKAPNPPTDVVVNDHWPIYMVRLTGIGHQRSKVFALVRELLDLSPAKAKELLDSLPLPVAQGPRMLVEPIASQFRNVGAEVEVLVADC